jgi:hypothetical protein
MVTWILVAFSFILLIHSGIALQCYRCVSSQPGCGKELSIRLERWHTCADTGPFGGENFCVKIIENIGSDVVITRDCLETLRHSTRHREKLPTVQRQNYCEYGRNNDPKHPYDYTKTFCFCNDWNGCNAASRVSTKFTGLLFVLFSFFYIVYMY